MNFTDRNQLFRKSDPTYKNKKSKEYKNMDKQEENSISMNTKSNFSCPDEIEYIHSIKRKGTSLARPPVNRQNSFINNNADSSKRISVLETSRQEGVGHSGGGTKLMNFIKSSLSLTKSRSKSKLNLNENRQSIYIQTPSKSEENLNALQNFAHYHIIKSTNLVLKPEDNNLYVKEYNNNNEEVLKSLLILDQSYLIQPLHPSIANFQNYCFQILKQESVDDMNQPSHQEPPSKNHLQVSQISKSYSYNSSFPLLKSGSIDTEYVNNIRCGSTSETNAWIARLKKKINPNYENTTRHEDLFKIWIQEAKNLLVKKRYYCEIKLDKILYARTSIKTMTDMVFWGEEFEFRGLQNINTISISLFRMIENKKKNEKSELVAQINVPCSDFAEVYFVEKWYTPSPDIRLSSSNLKYSQSSKLVNCPKPPEYDELMKNVIDCSPTIRIKGRYRPLQILPTYCYDKLSDFLVKQSINLVESLEPHLKVKSKEELVKILLLILEYKGCHIDFLSDLVTLEVTKAVEDTLIMRGNSVASKAIENFMKMIGEKYLSSLLSDLINEVILEELDYEVNPLKLNSSKEIHSITDKQNKLEKLVENVWNKIFNSSNLVPKDLKLVFSKIREKLSESKRVPSCNSPMIDQVISSCLFLRYICPAIMSPFLFGLANEYSDKACINRTLTLVAKSIQSLANFSQSPQSKEGYMGFMQRFINKNSNNMRSFLKNISSNSSSGRQLKESSDLSNSSSELDFLNLRRKDERFIDVGYHLAEFSFHLNIHLKDIPEKKYNDTLKEIRLLIDNIAKLNGVHDSETESISSNISNSCNIKSRIPTLVTKCEKNVQEIGNQCSFSKNSTSPNKSIEQNFKLLRNMKSFEVEENFSYIPIRNVQNRTAVEKKNQFTGDNYVNFEHCDSVIYDEPCPSNPISMRSHGGTNCLNEMEINDSWHKMVKECCNNSENHPGEISEESNNYTFNSSGYQSLSNFSPDDFDNFMNQHHGYINNEIFDQKLACSLPVKMHSSTIPSLQKNILNRFKKNSPLNNKKMLDIKYLEHNCRDSHILPGLGSSRETFESLENLSNLNTQSLSGSKSMLSLHQKKPLSNKTNSMTTNLEKEISGSYYSSDCSLSSKNRSSSINLQKFQNSLSMNVDLDPLICNEWKRIKLFLELFNIPKPIHNHGTAIEQYKQRTIDENRLISFLELKSINQSDINIYLPAAYRLLKSVYKQGKIPVDVLTKHLLQANKIIQAAYINQSISRQHSNTSMELHDNKSSGSSKLKNIESRRDVSHLSTYSKE